MDRIATAIARSYFEMTAAQLGYLERSPMRGAILAAVTDERMAAAGQLMLDGGIISLVQVLDAAERNMVVSEITIF